MVKKNFARGIEAFLGEQEIKNDKRSTRDQNQNKKTIETRTTFILEVDLLEQLKALAYWERKPLKQLVNAALKDYLSSKGNEYLEIALDNYKDNEAVKQK